MIARDKDDPAIRYMFPVKSSLAAEGCPIGFSFSEQGFEWIGKCEANIIDQEEIPPTVGNKLKAAEELLREMLKNAPIPSNIVYEKSEEIGIGARTLETAKKKINITSFRKDDTWYWKLPPKEESDCE